MLPRLIPVLLIENRSLIKTKKFSSPVYLGDPVNALRIYNEKEVDEVLIVDKSTGTNGPDFEFLEDLAKEAFMPMGYVGGIRNIDDAKKLISIGYEKVGFNGAVLSKPDLVKLAAGELGAQSVFVVVDFKKNLFGTTYAYTSNGSKNSQLKPLEFSKKALELGIGELIIQSIDKDGCMTGYDLDIIKEISKSATVPVVACGGAGSLNHFSEAIKNGAEAVAAGSFFVFMGQDRNSILINYPPYEKVEEIFGV